MNIPSDSLIPADGGGTPYGTVTNRRAKAMTASTPDAPAAHLRIP
jgi:hypothetical protein